MSYYGAITSTHNKQTNIHETAVEPKYVDIYIHREKKVECKAYNGANREKQGLRVMTQKKNLSSFR